MGTHDVLGFIAPVLSQSYMMKLPDTTDVPFTFIATETVR